MDMSAPGLPTTLQGGRSGVKRLSHTHEDIARWLLANPTAPLKACAEYFGYTQSWLSCIIHSDAFQTHLRKLQSEADAVVLLDVPARLRGVAATALDGLGDQVDHALKDGNGVLHRQFLLDASELALKSLGYGANAKQPSAPAGPMYQQNNYFNQPVSQAVLDKAREKLLNVGGPTEVHEASELSAGGEGDGSALQRQPAALSAPTTAEGPETSGVVV